MCTGDWQLNPMFGAAAMSLSSFLCCYQCIEIKLLLACMMHSHDRKEKIQLKAA